MNRGVFIVIEGTDGSGKSTQLKQLHDRLVTEGYEVATFKFPRYEAPSSHFIKEYLNGRYGTVEEVGPYTGSLFYALDRYAGAPDIRAALDQGKVVLVDRYVGSNMAHQGTKFHHPEERRGYFIWLDNLEFEMLKIPRPTLNLVLRVPATISQRLIDQHQPRGYTDKVRDLHEEDLGHLEKAVEIFDDMCQLFPRDYSRIDCTRGEELLSIDTIHHIIWQKITPLLPPKPRQRTVATPTAETPVTAEQERPLTGLVNAATTKALVLDQASQLLLQALETDGHLTCLEQPLHTVEHLTYHVPDQLPDAVQTAYRQHMDTLLEHHTQLTQRLQDHLVASGVSEAAAAARARQTAQLVLPAAVTTPTGLAIAANELPALVTRLARHPLPEVRAAGRKLTAASRQLFPTVALEAAKPGPKVSVLTKLAQQHLQDTHADISETVQLTDVWPRNELDLAADMLYRVSDVPLRSLRSTTAGWPYDTKVAVLEAYTSEHTGQSSTVLQAVRYGWDCLGDYQGFRDLQRRQLGVLHAQVLTPRYGYDVPKLIEDADLVELWEQAFDLSLTLYSQLQAADYPVEAQYAVLLGHRVRWQATYSAHQLIALHERADGQPYAPIWQTMRQKVAEVHPLLAELLLPSTETPESSGDRSLQQLDQSIGA